MAEVTLPPGPRKTLDVERLEGLLLEALVAAARDLKGAAVEEHDQLVYRKSPEPDSWHGDYLSGPNYRKSIWDARSLAKTSAEAKALTGYLWDSAALQKRISQDGDGVPSRDSWEDFTWTELIQAPFLYLCALSATRSLSEEGFYTAWHIDHEEARAAAKDVAGATCSGSRFVRALSPLLIHLPDGFSATLAPGVVLRAWSIDERCLFLTRYHQEYLDDDATTWARGGILQIDFVASTVTDDAVARSVTGQMDLVKWALAAARKSEMTFGEGGIILRSPSGWRGSTIRRQDNVVSGNKSWRLLSLDEHVASRAADLLLRVKSLGTAAPELQSIVWFFGRSHVASTSRDSLLDAAVGLESLLIPDPGESTYKFRLHGAALLSAVVEGDIDDDLKRIYELRSRAAHGTKHDEQDFERLAPRCRQLLAQAIVAAIQLVENGELTPADTGGDIAKALRDLVRRRVCRAGEPSNQLLQTDGRVGRSAPFPARS